MAQSQAGHGIAFEGSTPLIVPAAGGWDAVVIGWSMEKT